VVERVVVVLVAAGLTTAVSWVDVVVDVVAGSLTTVVQEVKNSITIAESAGMRMISFFIVWNDLLPRRVRRKFLLQMY
jgi:hypothetical protein